MSALPAEDPAEDPAVDRAAAPAPDAAPAPLSVICFLFDPNVGGPTIRARAVYTRMMAAGHAVRVAFPRGEGGAAGHIAEAGIPVDRLAVDKPVMPTKPLKFLRFALTFPLALWRTVAYLKRHRPDVIHVNGAFDVGPALAGRLAGVPVVWHLNDTSFGPRIAGPMGWVVRRLATRIVAAATRVAEHYNVAGMDPHIVHAPVDIRRFKARPAAGFPRAAPVLGLLANWNVLKRQDRFVEVIARLRTNGHEVRGRIMGKFLDSQKDYWEPIVARMTADGLDRVIETPGFVADVPAAMADLDVLLLTSVSEASPICVLEAMAIGLPQVVFDVGGVREQLGEGDGAAGLVVPEGDIDAMVAAVERLLGDPALYAAMAANGQARARAEFSLEACVARHEAAYAAAIAAGARAGGRRARRARGSAHP